MDIFLDYLPKDVAYYVLGPFVFNAEVFLKAVKSKNVDECLWILSIANKKELIQVGIILELAQKNMTIVLESLFKDNYAALHTLITFDCFLGLICMSAYYHSVSTVYLLKVYYEIAPLHRKRQLWSEIADPEIKLFAQHMDGFTFSALFGSLFDPLDIVKFFDVPKKMFLKHTKKMLIMAARYGNLDLVQHLVTFVTDHKTLCYALQTASFQNHHLVVQFLEDKADRSYLKEELLLKALNKVTEDEGTLIWLQRRVGPKCRDTRFLLAALKYQQWSHLLFCLEGANEDETRSVCDFIDQTLTEWLTKGENLRSVNGCITNWSLREAFQMRDIQSRLAQEAFDKALVYKKYSIFLDMSIWLVLKSVDFELCINKALTHDNLEALPLVLKISKNHNKPIQMDPSWLISTLGTPYLKPLLETNGYGPSHLAPVLEQAIKRWLPKDVVLLEKYGAPMEPHLDLLVAQLKEDSYWHLKDCILDEDLQFLELLKKYDLLLWIRQMPNLFGVLHLAFVRLKWDVLCFLRANSIGSDYITFTIQELQKAGFEGSGEIAEFMHS